MRVPKKLIFYCLVVTIFLKPSGANKIRDLQNDISLQIKNHNGISLTRKRRFLMFPSGSSFQLVFCLTYPSVGVGGYFVFGHTAALAFELPSMPLFFDQRDFQKKEEEPVETTTTEVLHDFEFSEFDHNDHERSDSDFSPLNPNSNWELKNSYGNPFLDYLPNPGYTFIKWPSHSGYNTNDNLKNENTKYTNDFSEDNNFQRFNTKTSHMSLNMNPKYYSVHRRTRRDIYKKIENFLTTLNLDGKSCILKAICEIKKSTQEKGSFMEEVFKAIFRVKPHDRYQDEDEYDTAANSEHNCTEVYSTCTGSIRNFQLVVR